MIGLIAGDVIGSPYVKNPVKDAASYFFPLFEASAKLGKDVNGRPHYDIINPAPTVVTRLTLAAERWLSGGEGTVERWNELYEEIVGSSVPTPAEMLSVCIPAVKGAGTLEQAQSFVSVMISSRGFSRNQVDAFVGFTSAVWSLREVRSEAVALNAPKKGRSLEELGSLLSGDGGSPQPGVLSGPDVSLEEASAVLEPLGVNVHSSPSEIRPFIMGEVKLVGGQLTRGDGRVSSALPDVIGGVFSCIRDSRSYEEAVRKAVAVGGPSSVMAALAGGIGEMRWGVPKEIVDKVNEYITIEEQDHISRFVDGRREEMDMFKVNGVTIPVIHQRGCIPVYLVDKVELGMEQFREISEAVEALHSERNTRFEIVSDRAEFNKVLAERSIQRDAEGRELFDTFVEMSSPEVRNVFYQDGVIRSIVTRKGVGVNDGKPLDSEVVRRETMRNWLDLVSYIEDVRNQIDQVAGLEVVVDAPMGMAVGHVRTATGMVPDVTGYNGVVRQGDIVKLKFGLDDDCRFWVDAMPEGGFHEEGIDGILNTRSLLGPIKGENATMKDIRQAIAEHCLDEGKGFYTEDELKAIEEGDAGQVYSKTEGIEKMHASNLDLIEKEIPVKGLRRAVLPVDYARSMDDIEAESKRREASVQSRGTSIKDVDMSTIYKGAAFTFGLSNHTPAELLAMCRRYGIETVLDVRPEPGRVYREGSRTDSESLEKLFSDAGIVYNDFSELSEGTEGKSFDEITSGKDYREGMDILREGVLNGRRALILGAEYEPSESTRFCLSARSLVHGEPSIPVYHIQYNGSPVSHEDLETSMLRNYRLDGSADVEEPAINIYSGTGQHSDLSNFAKRDVVMVVPKKDFELSEREKSFLMTGTGFTDVKCAVEALAGLVSYESDEAKAKAVSRFEKLVEVKTFPTAEHAFQYCKTFFFEVTEQDGEISSRSLAAKSACMAARKQILSSGSPAEARKIGHGLMGSGRRGTGYFGKDWEFYGPSVMKCVLMRSYDPALNPKAWELLDRTGSLRLLHLQDRTVWGHEFPKALTAVRDTYRKKIDPKTEKPYGKKWTKDELIAPDPLLDTPEKRIAFAYNLRERSIFKGKENRKAVARKVSSSKRNWIKH